MFRAARAEAPHTRVPVARCLTMMGPAATPLRDLLTSELTAPHRQMTGGEGAYGGHDVPADEEWVRLCREVPAAL
ncbi:hypothetical protein [Streptomyces sp. NPDC006309]|uniref:hypothetical protein n=1 Tax=Streptomyces sp. NPDC006309 TaxID=3156749 RepID=UPI0033ACA449